MRARRYGRIVNLASIAAIGTALSGNAFYAATKAEVVIHRRLLRPRRKRPSRRAADEQRDELAAEGQALAISMPRDEWAVLKHFLERMPYAVRGRRRTSAMHSQRRAGAVEFSWSS
jgi:hypothetical protein